MAEIRPFRGLRYASSEGPLGPLTAPPYDVLDAAGRADFASRSPHNIVHLTLPQGEQDDRSKYVKYAKSAAILADWRREGVVVPEAKPAFYRYVQEFAVPGSSERFRRTSVIVLLKVEPYSASVVLPHEQTFPKHKEDRQRLLEATRTHLETIFGVFEDESGEIHAILDTAPATESLSFTDEEGTVHFLEPITDTAVKVNLEKSFEGVRIWIADGHHRYETALKFRENMGEQPHRIAEDYIPIALVSMADPGLILLPTHRMLEKLPMPVDEFLKKLAPEFEVRPISLSAVVPGLSEGEKGVFFFVAEGGAYELRIKLKGTESLLEGLDVSILHNVILAEKLGIMNSDAIRYTRNAEEALSATYSFLMTPPSVDDMKDIALAGEKMPHKSTFFFPKMRSGLVFYGLNDF